MLAKDMAVELDKGYIAMNISGQWNWFLNKPKFNRKTGFWYTSGNSIDRTPLKKINDNHCSAANSLLPCGKNSIKLTLSKKEVNVIKILIEQRVPTQDILSMFKLLSRELTYIKKYC